MNELYIVAFNCDKYGDIDTEIVHGWDNALSRLEELKEEITHIDDEIFIRSHKGKELKGFRFYESDYDGNPIIKDSTRRRFFV